MRWQAGGGEEFALPLLGGGVVDLEDVQVRVRVAVGEGVEAGAEERRTALRPANFRERRPGREGLRRSGCGRRGRRAQGDRKRGEL